MAIRKQEFYEGAALHKLIREGAVPGIRYVVDTGLARLSRYNPHTRTRRLPIEAVSQSSANQRKGRCGRVSEGICVRLYSEADFNERPPYAQPEIQRHDIVERIESRSGPHQIEYMKTLRMGNDQYELITL